MDRRTDILTPDNVTLAYELAGIGSRFVALFYDTLLQMLAVGGLAFVVWLLASLASVADVFADLLASTWTVAAAILLLATILWGYFPLFETTWNGQTPGKRAVGIRVMRDGGFPVDFRTVLIRNLIRFADWLPGCYGIGGASVLLRADCKRLGDLAAGTIVIRERQEQRPEPATEEASPRPDELEAAPPFDASLIAVERLGREQLQGIRRYLDRRGSLDDRTQSAVARKLAQPLLGMLDLSPADIAGRYDEFLAFLVAQHEKQQMAHWDL